ncbi:MAG: hypothetical protein H6606_11195 [Flavobacteriales bacterium]|nr:hypothetical protein [Flavobacteriales bacterium]
MWAFNMVDTLFRGGELLSTDQAQDRWGNYFAAGNFEYTARLNLRSDSLVRRVSSGDYDIFLAKYDTADRPLWVNIIRANDAIVQDLAVDTLGNIFIAGHFEGKLDADPSDSGEFILRSRGNTDGFLIKYSSSGALLWAIHIGGLKLDEITSLAVGMDQMPVVSGIITDSAIFDPMASKPGFSRASSGAYSLFLAKYDGNGRNKWVRIFEGFGRTYGMAIDDSLSVIITGYFTNTLDFDPSPSSKFARSSKGYGDVFIARYSSAGAFRWARAFGTSGYAEFGKAVAIGPNNSVWATGEYENTIDLDSNSSAGSHSSQGASDIYILGLESNGNFIKSLSIGGRSSDEVDGIAVSDSSEVAIAGAFSYTVQFDPINSSASYTSQGSFDAFLSVYDTGFRHNWTVTFGDGNTQAALSLVDRGNSEFRICGQMKSAADFDPSASSYTLTVPHSDFNGFVATYRDSAVLVQAALLGNERSGTASANVADMVVDRAGNSYVIGTYSGVMDVDPSDSVLYFNAGNSNVDMFLIKYDSSGSLKWAITSNGVNGTRGNAICLDSFGNVYATGSYHNTVDFDPSTSAGTSVTNQNANNTFVAKYSTDGKFEWVKGFRSHQSGTSKGWNAGHDIAADRNGDVLVTGLFRDQVDFDPSSARNDLNSRGGDDHYVVRLDSSGQFIWAERFGGTSWEYEADLVLDDSGNVYVAGNFQSSATFSRAGDTLLSAGGIDMFLQKFDTAGTLLYAFSLGGRNSDFVEGIILNHRKEPLLMGRVSDSLDLDPGSGTYMIYPKRENFFLANFNTNGAIKWARTYGAEASYDVVRDIVLDANGEILISGMFNERTELSDSIGQGPIDNLGSFDIFVALYDTAGRFRNSWQMAGFGEESGDAIACLDGRIWIGGYFEGQIDIDPSESLQYLRSVNTNDAFLLHFPHCNTYEEKQITVCDSAVFQGRTYRNSERIELRYPNVYESGCDSIVRIFLTVIPTIHEKAYHGCDSLRIGGKLFTNSVVLYDTFKRSAVCDSIVKTSIRIDRTVLQLDTMIACSAVSFFGKIYDTSGWVQHRFQKGASTGCDSVLRVWLDIRIPGIDSLTRRSCDSISHRGNWYFSSQYVTDTLTAASANGCDSFVVTYLHVTKSSGRTIQLQACDSFIFKGRTYTNSTTIFDTLQNKAGCDSLLRLELRISNTHRSTVHLGVCDSLRRPDSTYMASTVLVDSLKSRSGCDSIITTYLTVNNTIRQYDTLDFCDQASYKGFTYNRTVTLVDYRKGGAGNGCDSFHYMHLIVHRSGRDTVERSACDSIIHKGRYYYKDTELTDTIRGGSANGCDSLVTYKLQVRSGNHTFWQMNACDSFTFKGVTHFRSGTIHDTLRNSLGCDSISTLQLHIFNSIRDTIRRSGCDSIRYRGTTYYNSVFRIDTLRGVSPNGCDSIVTAQLVTGKTNSYTWQIDACDSFIFQGITYSSSVRLYDTLVNRSGCDSVLTTVINITPVDRDTQRVQACDSLYFRGQFYYTNQLITDTLKGKCDSITYHLLLVHHSEVLRLDTLISKGDTIWIGPKPYFDEGSYTDTLFNDTCYTVVKLDLKWKTGSVRSIDELEGFRIYPNPGRGIVHVESRNPIGEFRIEDGTGSLVYLHPEPDFQRANIYLQLASGVYFYTATTADGKRIVGKLILLGSE